MNKYKGMAILAMAASTCAAYADVTLEKGKDIPLVFTQALSSKTAKEGDKVMLKVASDVMEDGTMILKSGTAVSGVIVKVDKKDRFGKNARLRIALNPVKSLAGEMIALQPRDKGNVAKGSQTDKAALASGGGALLLGPIGLLGGYFITGKAVNIKPGDKLETEVSKTVVLDF